MALSCLITEERFTRRLPMQKHYVELTPLGRMGEPDDVALPVVFLASDDSRWISGELILVAGGE